MIPEASSTARSPIRRVGDRRSGNFRRNTFSKRERDARVGGGMPANSTSRHPAHRSSRRQFIRTSSRLAAASALAGLTLPHLHASPAAGRWVEV
jgi:hypothetical protein